MKVNLLQTQDIINRVGSLTVDELSIIEEQLKQIGEDVNPFIISEQV